MFPAQLTGWTDAARAAARIESTPADGAQPPPKPRPAESRYVRWTGAVLGIAACVAIGLTAWWHVNL